MSAGAIRAVTLDALGTLLELQPPAPLLVRELGARGVHCGERDAALAVRAEIAYYRAHHHEAVDAAALEDLRDRCTEVLRGALAPAAADLDHGELRGALLAAIRFRPFPEVPGALRALRDAGLALVVVSNWDVSLHAALEDTGLRELVDAAFSSAELGVAKPDPRIFAPALRRAGADPGEALHAGDSVQEDVAGALAAGMRAVLVARGADGQPPGASGPWIASLAELPALAT